MKQFTLKELDEQFKDSFKKVYDDFYKNSSEVREALLKSQPDFIESYFFNNGIKHIFGLLRELQEIKNETNSVDKTLHDYMVEKVEDNVYKTNNWKGELH